MHSEFQNNVNQVIKKYSTKTAITYMKNNDKEEIISFGEVGDFIRSSAQEFVAIGLVKGDRVAIISPHSPYAVFMGMALTYSGITVVLIDAALPQEEIERLLEFSDVRAIFTVSKIYDKFNGRYNIPCFSLEQGLKIVPFDIEKSKCHKLSPTKDPENDVIAILFSSGTTDQMKGIKVTYKSVLAAREVFVRLAGLKDYMTYLLVLPFNHIAGFTGAMTYFLTGCGLGFIEDVNASKLAEGLLRFQPYYFAMVPAVYEVMEQKIRAKLHEKGKVVEGTINLLLKLSGFLRKNFGLNIGKKLFKGITSQVFGENIFGIGTGASPCKKSTAEFYLNLGLEWANLYATTETSVPIVATGVHDRYPADTIGKVNAHPEIQIKIGNPDENGIGEILVKSELMMKGYFRQPELTKDVFEDGYFKTGDYGFIDKKGYLHMTGRIKESIVLRTGKKVSPLDVDEYYSSRMPDIELASRGITNEKESYDEIHMFVEDKSFSENEKENILKEFNDISRQAPIMYKVEGVHFIQQIPKTTVGKVKRFSLEIPVGAEELPVKTGKEYNRISEQRSEEEILFQVINRITENKENRTYNKAEKLEQDIGLDSLNIFEMCVALQERTGISIEDSLHKDITIGDVLSLISQKNYNATSYLNMNNFPCVRTPSLDRKLSKWLKIMRNLYKIRVSGLDNIKGSSFIVCSNHASYFDPLWILAAMGEERFDKNKLACLAAIHTMESHKNIFDMIGSIPVEREGNTAPAIKRIKECLEDEYIVIIFPEGARSRDGSMLPFKEGASKIAIDTGKKILPVKINGGFEVFPRSRKRPHLFNWAKMKKYIIDIKFGEMIEPYDKSQIELTSQLKEIIERM